MAFEIELFRILYEVLTIHIFIVLAQFLICFYSVDMEQKSR